jgi:hypothetical protein
MRFAHGPKSRNSHDFCRPAQGGFPDHRLILLANTSADRYQFLTSARSPRLTTMRTMTPRSHHRARGSWSSRPGPPSTKWSPIPTTLTHTAGTSYILKDEMSLRDLNLFAHFTQSVDARLATTSAGERTPISAVSCPGVEPRVPTMNTQHAAGVRDGHEAPDRARSRRISQGPMRPPFQRDPHTTAMPMPSTATASKRKATARRGMPPKFWNRCTKTGPPGSTWKDLGPPTNRRIETAEAALWRPPASTAAASVNSAAHPMSPRTSTGHRRCVGIGAAGELTP